MDEARRQKVGEAIGKIASGMGVLTSADGERRTGVLVSWFQQVSFVPPMVMVAVKKGRAIEGLIQGSRNFSLCMLAEDDNDLMRHFSKGYDVDAEAFNGLAVETRATGSPVLTGSLAYVECKLVSTCQGGDHDIFIGEVVDGAVLDGARRPMIHVRKTGLSY